MQDIVCTLHTVHTGSAPPHDRTVGNANMETKPNLNAKEQSLNQSSRSDSGIFSATANSSYPEDAMDSSNQVVSSDTDNRSDCSSPDTQRKYFCPICKTALTSQHDFTVHIRLHNNTDNNEIQDDKGFVCRICKKKLSSSSSLDRHVLIHSGERPFSCKYCGDTFTTNGNMHRHVRTHSIKGNESYESDGSTDSSNSNRQIEYNNNKVEGKSDNKRKLGDVEDLSNKPKISFQSSDETQSFKCPICDRTDFDSIKALEVHFEDNHPDYPVTCSECSIRFPNSKVLSNHRNSVHCEENGKKNCVTGFKDLTFVDFSSEKFPHIARYQCERSLHKVSGGLKFQCQKCSHAFPCSSSLEIHETDCSVGLNLSVKTEGSGGKSELSPKLSETEIKKVDFFGRLDLLDSSPEKSQSTPVCGTKLQQHLLETAVKRTIDNNKDLADIQSIISMTSNGSLLQQLCQKPAETSTSPQQLINGSSPDLNKSEQEEESQDVFATEFRKMKLRGEFPCRLCTAIFPNLRALKGHNRTHLNSMTNGTYRCNMCPHSSTDKAALIRHMRTHNGDRPYECSLCNYAFTTKANCERHLRNRHSKSTREEVKKAIIYHPSEDPTNDELNKLSLREEPRKTVVNYPEPAMAVSPEKMRSSTPKLLHANIPETVNALKMDVDLKPNHKEPRPQYNNISDLIHSENIKSLKDHRLMNIEPLSPFPLHQYGYVPKEDIPTTILPPKIHVKPLDVLKQTPFETEDHTTCDGVLDLSKKRKDPPPEQTTHEETPQDLTKKSVPMNVGEILAQQLLKHNPHKIDTPNLYAAQLALYRNGLSVPNWNPFPLLFPALPPFLTQEAHQEFKEKLQRSQLCGGNFVDRLKNLHLATPAFNGLNSGELQSPPFPTTSKEDLQPLTLNVEQPYNTPEGLSKLNSPLSQSKNDILQSPNSVKMVIKNGVLMPKQKQRRYRTERPFSCEHCAARFTLRSNMERHIKQQHPQYWSQRQRSGLNNPGRKTQTITTNNMKNYCDINIPTYDLPKVQHNPEKSDNHIDDKLKYAILAHHLRNAQNLKPNHYNHHHQERELRREEDEDCDLIIDENEEARAEARQEILDDDDGQHGMVLEDKLKQLHARFEQKMSAKEDAQDLVPVARLLDNASQQQFKEYFRRDVEEQDGDGISEEDEEGLVASGSTSEGNNSGTDENRSEPENTTTNGVVKKKSAYSSAPNRVSCPYCSRKFPWTSSLRRHILTHTGQKPFKCSHCTLLFTTKSNCDRHLLRKHGNSATTITNNHESNNTANYLMRNVPERPFKCSTCPSSTFSTYSNLKKHISSKHSTNAQGDDIRAQGYEAGSSEDEKASTVEPKSDWDNHVKVASNETNPPSNSDLPFKCHLCERSFGERQDALDHIKHYHASEYDLLMSKNALDMNATTPDETTHHDDDENELRGKFPDYSNRKVICAFCMRRFWSAEDLRRHMRTHTGERPFSCDICRRRFTLKHSMLRHRKKHNVSSAFEADNANSDEDVEKMAVENNNVSVNTEKTTDESDGNEGSDLISNLLGINDKTILDQVLTASADDAAKLLGVKNGAPE